MKRESRLVFFENPIPKEKEKEKEKNKIERSEDTYDHLFKIQVIGDSGVGKSNLILRFADGVYTDSYLSTLGVDFKMANLEIGNKKVKLQIFDNSGTTFRSPKGAYYRGADAVLLVGDLTDAASMHHIKAWKESFMESGENSNAIFILVATKSDMAHQRVVEPDYIESLANELDCEGAVIISSKENVNIDALFRHTAKALFNKKNIPLEEPVNSTRCIVM